MDGLSLAQKVLATYCTNNIHQLAQQAGVSVVYGRWYPTTFGEFDKKTKIISINLNALMPTEQVVLHELGHYFLDLWSVHLTKKEEENVVDGFVKAFLESN
jgi:Zn-dependent peptidase ImmA (M78 family)